MEAVTRPDTHATSGEVRKRLVEALELDLVGPWPGHALAEEMLPGWVRPSNWYLTGFLTPTDAPPEQSGDLDADDALDVVPDTEGLAEESAQESGAAKRSFFPASMGISALVASEAQLLCVTVRWGDYEPGEYRPEGEAEGDEGDRSHEDGGKSTAIWQRTPREQTLDVRLGAGSGVPTIISVPESAGLRAPPPRAERPDVRP